MSDKNIDKDIEVLELTIECLKETMEYEDIYETEVSHIVISKKDMESFDNVLLELETYKKIAEKLAEDKIIPKCKNCSDEDTHECTECALDWARKEVENGN